MQKTEKRLIAQMLQHTVHQAWCIICNHSARQPPQEISALLRQHPVMQGFYSMFLAQTGQYGRNRLDVNQGNKLNEKIYSSHFIVNACCG